MAGAGPPVLLLHGFPQTHLTWRHVAPALTDQFTVACPDLPGYGSSEAPSAMEAFSKRATAARMVELMAELGHSHFAVIGHDRGGAGALAEPRRRLGGNAQRPPGEGIQVLLDFAGPGAETPQLGRRPAGPIEQSCRLGAGAGKERAGASLPVRA